MLGYEGVACSPLGRPLRSVIHGHVHSTSLAFFCGFQRILLCIAFSDVRRCSQRGWWRLPRISVAVGRLCCQHKLHLNSFIFLTFVLLFLPPGQLAPSVYVLVDIYAAAMCSEACKAEPCAALAKRWTPAGPPMQRDRRTPELRGRPTGAVRGCGARARSQGALTRRPVVRKVALAVLQIAEFMAYHRARAMTAKIRSRFFAVFKRLRQTHPTLLRQSCSHRLRTRTYKHVRSRFVIPELVLSRRAVLPSG